MSSTFTRLNKLLENSLLAYFAVEESVAEALHFDFAQHRLAHQRLMTEFQQVRDELIAKNGRWLEPGVRSHIDSLRYRLIQHIKEDAKPLKSVLSTHFYDFIPS